MTNNAIYLEQWSETWLCCGCHMSVVVMSRYSAKCCRSRSLWVPNWRQYLMCSTSSRSWQQNSIWHFLR